MSSGVSAKLLSRRTSRPTTRTPFGTGTRSSSSLADIEAREPPPGTARLAIVPPVLSTATLPTSLPANRLRQTIA